MLQTGMKAPEFALVNQQGDTVRLSDFLGKKVVLYFYPRDNTPGCTRQACAFAAGYAAFREIDAVVIGVSKDSVKSHKNFKEKHSLPFTLLADTATDMIKSFGVWGEKTLYGRKYMGTIRATFIFDEFGILTEIIEKVDTSNHAAQILK